MDLTAIVAFGPIPSPMNKSVSVPLEILLMAVRHMGFVGTVLPGPAINPSVGTNPVIVVVNLNHISSSPDVYFVLYVLVGN